MVLAFSRLWNPRRCGSYRCGLSAVHDFGICFTAGQKAEGAGKNQRLSFAKADDPPYFCLWPAIFYYERPQFVYGDLRQSVSVAYSDTAIAFFGAYFKVQQLIVMTVNGLIQGCLPVMRFNYGAGNRERLHSAFRYGTALVTGMMILGTLAVILFPAQILGLFTASEAMRSFGISAMRIMAASYLFCGLSTMISTYFQATEKVISSMLIQLLRQLLLLIPFMWCMEKLLKITESGCHFLSPKQQHLFWCSCSFKQTREKKHFAAIQSHSNNQEGETIWKYRLKKGLMPYKQKLYFTFCHRLYGMRQKERSNYGVMETLCLL